MHIAKQHVRFAETQVGCFTLINHLRTESNNCLQKTMHNQNATHTHGRSMYIQAKWSSLT